MASVISYSPLSDISIDSKKLKMIGEKL